jgi:hypothetical protein
MKLLYPLTTLLAGLAATTTVVSAEGIDGGIVETPDGHLSYETAAESSTGRAFTGIIHPIDWVKYDELQQDTEDRTDLGVIIGGITVTEPSSEPPTESNVLLQRRNGNGRPDCARNSMAKGRGGRGGMVKACNGLRGRRQEESN